MPTDLFQSGDFTLHSGQRSRWIIDCRAFTPEGWRTLALIASERLEPFGQVIGVPQGGEPFADALRQYTTPDDLSVLIADDVWTTGASIRDVRQSSVGVLTPWHGVVVFARAPVPSWVTALCQMGGPDADQ